MLVSVPGEEGDVALADSPYRNRGGGRPKGRVESHLAYVVEEAVEAGAPEDPDLDAGH